MDDACKLKKNLLLFNVDFGKAYDLVNWSYLKVVMIKMNFTTLWRKWILECVTTPSAPMLVNGSPTDEFKWKEAFVKEIIFLLIFCFC